MQSRLPLWQAALYVVLGGVGGQLAAGLTASLVRVWLVGHGQAARALQPNAATLVPAMLASSATLVAVSVFAPAFAGLELKASLGLRPSEPRFFALAALGTVALGPLADLAMRTMQELLPRLNLGVLSMLHDLVRVLPWYVSWPALALLPGISEELLFRGLLQTAAERRRGAIAISALAFSFFHVDPHHVAGVLPLGFFLAWVRSRCGTLVTMFAHVVNNSAAIVAVHHDALDVGYGTDKPMPLGWLPVSLLVVLACVAAIARGTTPQTPSHAPLDELQ